MVPLAPPAVALGVTAAVMAAQASAAPTSDIVQWGSAGVLSMAFLYVMWGLSQNRIVSRDAARIEDELIELAQKAIALTEHSLEREKRLEDLAARQLSWLEGKAGR